MREAVLHLHLGLGDMLINNALVRELSKDRVVTVLCKHQNCSSARFQWRDDKNIHVFGVADDSEAEEACRIAKSQGFEIIRNGLHKKDDTFDISKWDQEFYRQAGVDFEKSWTEFKFPNSLPGVVDTVDYTFIHEDQSRGFIIDRNRFTKMNSYSPEPRTDSIFEWVSLIQGASEIHCIDSSFAILADRIPTVAKRIVLHGYARQGIKPTYKKNWEILA